MTDKHYNLIVIGGGPSGMMAAGRAAERGKSVLLLEKNSTLGNKLKISGGGRCNLTNAVFDVRLFLQVFGKSAKYLYSTFSQFSVEDTFDFFQSRGLELKIEDRNRAFPVTDNAWDVFLVLKKYMETNNVTVLTSHPVTKINSKNNTIVSVEADDKIFTADNYLFATGGISHPETGSTGDGFQWLEQLGHVIQKSNPNLVPLAVQEQWIKNLSGVTLDPMRISFYLNDKKQFSKVGRLLFTHFGISGPLILNSSFEVKKLLDQGPTTACIDMYPKLDEGSLEKQIIDIFDKTKNKNLKNILKILTPNGMSKGLVNIFKEELLDKKVHSITKNERKQIIKILKNLPLTIKGLMGLDKAIISDGGIALDEVDMKTMQSKICENLYITGDLLHINRPSGGFSLQLCWTTGFVVGNHV